MAAAAALGFGAASPAFAQAAGSCDFSTSFGGNTSNPANGEGLGPVVLDSGALYSENGSDIIDIEWSTRTNQAQVNADNFDGKTTIANIAINGTSMLNTSVGGDGKVTSPGYAVHGAISKSWIDRSGSGHTLLRGDVVTWSINVTYTNSAGGLPISGNTGAACTV